MLSAIYIQNFKGIGQREKLEDGKIPLRPITIMFGKNSAGKSTVVQALHYAREILHRQNLDADRTLYGGKAVNLGGFRNFVHNRDLRNEIILGFDLNLEETDYPDYGFNPFEEEKTQDLNGRVQSARVTLTIKWSDYLNRPVLTKYETAINHEKCAYIETSLDGKNISAYYNALHPLLITDLAGNVQKSIFSFSEENSDDNEEWMLLKAVNITSSLPAWGKSIQYQNAIEIRNLRNAATHLAKDLDSFDELEEKHTQFVEMINRAESPPISELTASQMLVAPGEILHDWLMTFRYLGPLRTVPPRNFEPSTTIDESEWSDGLAAWSELYRRGAGWVEEVSNWLSSNRLKTGYLMKLLEYRENFFDGNFANEFSNENISSRKRLSLFEEEAKLKVSPQDIGVGISQIVPVVVAALSFNEGLIAIEQPELHLHPAVQAELGDLFIKSSLDERTNIFLLETHSEHLILRILRRIREQSENELPEDFPEINPEDFQMLYVKSSENGTIFFDISVTEEGDFAEKLPDGFFPERAKELF